MIMGVCMCGSVSVSVCVFECVRISVRVCVFQFPTHLVSNTEKSERVWELLTLHLSSSMLGHCVFSVMIFQCCLCFYVPWHLYILSLLMYAVCLIVVATCMDVSMFEYGC